MSGGDSVAVVGGGGHGKVVVATLKAAGREVAGVFDRDRALWGTTVLGVEVVGWAEELARLGIRRAVLAIGDNRRRGELATELAELELDWQTVAHPSAVVHDSVRLGAGSVVFAGAVLQPDSSVGRHAIVNTAASVDHDCALGDLVHVAPGARLAGGVAAGTGALLGIGCSVLPGLAIGDWAVVGSGAAVVRDVAAGASVKGVPAR